MPFGDWLKCASVAAQIGVAVYALSLNRLPGWRRAGWFLFGAFTLMAATYAVGFWQEIPMETPPEGAPEVVYLFSSHHAFIAAVAALGGAAPEVVYLCISLLLVAGLRHIQTVFQERLGAEAGLQAAKLQLERDVRDREAALAKLNGNLAKEMEERRRLQGQLMRSQRLEALGQLATGTAHYFNNLLTVVQSCIQPLLAKENQDEATIKRLRQVRAATQRTASLTRQLMTFTRKQAMQREVLDLDEVIRQLTPRLRLTLGEEIVLRIEKPETPLLIYADAAMMEQILENLTSNGRDAMPQGGQLTIGADKALVDEKHERHHPEARAGEFVRLTVRDTGTGMSPEIMERVFEPFFTTKGAGKGAGLGLATIYGIVAQHGGWIEVESQVDRGTTFAIFLPSASQVTQ